MIKNTWKKIKKARRFTGRVFRYMPVAWNDEDFDYGYILDMMELKLGDLRLHILDHNMFVESENRAAEIGVALNILKRYKEEHSTDEERLWAEFFDYLKANMRGWWC